MLEQLLKEIRAGGTLETGKLAARLGTTPQLIEAMLEHLQRARLDRALYQLRRWLPGMWTARGLSNAERYRSTLMAKQTRRLTIWCRR